MTTRGTRRRARAAVDSDAHAGGAKATSAERPDGASDAVPGPGTGAAPWEVSLTPVAGGGWHLQLAGGDVLRDFKVSDEELGRLLRGRPVEVAAFTVRLRARYSSSRGLLRNQLARLRRRAEGGPDALGPVMEILFDALLACEDLVMWAPGPVQGQDVLDVLADSVERSLHGAGGQS